MTERRFYEDPAASDGRVSAPAALRNREAIAEVLAEWLPASGLVLELASGTGEHAAFFARRFPALDWQPSDREPVALRSISAWRAANGAANLRPPLTIDAQQAEWGIDAADAILSINMVHISPWSSALGLLDGAARLLAPGAQLILYGPWLVEGEEAAPSNLAFDADLRARDPDWGLRKVGEFSVEARRRRLDAVARRAMPANNLMLQLVKR